MAEHRPVDNSSLMTASGFYGSKNKRKWIGLQNSIEFAVKRHQQEKIPKSFPSRILGPSTKWQTFFRQQDAFKLCRSSSKDLHVFAFESESFGGNTGQRMYLAASYPVFWHYYNQMNESKKHHYEVIAEGAVCKLYFDLEFDRTVNLHTDGDRLVDTFIKYICLALGAEFGVKVGRKHVLDLDASTDFKFSRHLIFQMKNAAFQNNIHAGWFVCYILSRLFDGARSNDNNKLNDDKTNKSDQKTTPPDDAVAPMTNIAIQQRRADNNKPDKSNDNKNTSNDKKKHRDDPVKPITDLVTECEADDKHDSTCVGLNSAQDDPCKFTSNNFDPAAKNDGVCGTSKVEKCNPSIIDSAVKNDDICGTTKAEKYNPSIIDSAVENDRICDTTKTGKYSSNNIDSAAKNDGVCGTTKSENYTEFNNTSTITSIDSSEISNNICDSHKTRNIHCKDSNTDESCHQCDPNNTSETNGQHSSETNGQHSSENDGQHSSETNGQHSSETNGQHSSETNGQHSSENDGQHSSETNGQHSSETIGQHSSETNGQHSSETNGQHSSETNGQHSSEPNGQHSSENDGQLSSETNGQLSSETNGQHSSENDDQLSCKPNSNVTDTGPVGSCDGVTTRSSGESEQQRLLNHCVHDKPLMTDKSPFVQTELHSLANCKSTSTASHKEGTDKTNHIEGTDKINQSSASHKEGTNQTDQSDASSVDIEVLERSKYCEILAEFSAEELEALIVQNKRGDDILFCDTGVYTKNRNFRLYQSSKLHKNNPLVLSTHNQYQPHKLAAAVSPEQALFCDSLIANVQYSSGLKILTFDKNTSTALGFNSSSQRNSQKHRESADCSLLDGYSASPYPEVDEYITSVIRKDSGKGVIRHWTYFQQGELLVYDVAKYRYCHNIGRHHKSNNIMLVADLQRGVYYQKCYDPTCHTENYKSTEWQLPRSILPASYFDDLGNDLEVDLCAEKHDLDLHNTSISDDKELLNITTEMEKEYSQQNASATACELDDGEDSELLQSVQRMESNLL